MEENRKLLKKKKDFFFFKFRIRLGGDGHKELGGGSRESILRTHSSKEEKLSTNRN